MAWWQYLLLVNIYLLLFYGFYALLLRRETFFQLNRLYLVSAVLLSFFIPMIQADWVKNLFITQKVELTIYSSQVLSYRFKPIRDTHITLGQILTALYLSGIALLAIRLIWQFIALKRIINNPAPSAAFAFFKKIRLGNDHGNNTAIAEHERAHARQWHSADVLIMELLLIVNWFNPVVYLYRYAIKHIHEYIADQQALKAGTGKADYALILLSETFNTPSHRLVNPFFSKSLLKQRIEMLQKDRSRRVALFKYFLSAPLFMLMLILSSATVNKSRAIYIINNKVQQVMLMAPANMVDIVPVHKDAGKKATVADVYIEKINPAAPKKEQADITIDPAPPGDAPVFTAVEQNPSFPGGVNAFYQFLAKNIRYPQEARDQNVQGRLIIGFIVEKDGGLSNFKILRSLGYGTDEEALRVLALSPKWIPGIQNGRSVRVNYTIPISFTLTDESATSTAATPANAKGNYVLFNHVNGADTNQRLHINKIPDSLRFASGPPLFLVDGQEVPDLANINPKDIESITVYKDKLHTALYGEKAKYGVLVVTTKKVKLLKLKLVETTKN